MNSDPDHPALSATRPLFVDNRDGNTLAKAIQRHLRTLRDESALPWEVSIAAAFFNVQGFDLLAADLDEVSRVRLLLGAEPRPEAERALRRHEAPAGPELTEREVRDALKSLDTGLARERDLLPFDADSDRAVRRLLDYLHGGKIEVRRVVNRFLHAKAFIFRVAGGGTVVGSSNLTYAGLRGNLELNLGHYEDPVVGRVEGWFDELWEDAEPYDLAAVFDRLMAEFDPHLIFLRVLWELYADELQEEEQEVGHIPVTAFQKHGIWRARRIMAKYGGAIVADGVGLGKTFTAGEIIRQYREKRQRVLVVCPASLRDSTWNEFQDRFDLRLTCVSYEQLAQDKAFGGTSEHLGRYPDEYQLVVIDEAHNYRNPDAPTRAAILRQLLMGKPRDLLMLTATPVNNNLWDLYHLLRYFIRQDGIFADLGVLSLRDRFDEAMEEDPFDLSPDLLYPIIDATTVKRTRRFIMKHYEDDLIEMPDGSTRAITFPKPVPSSINYSLTGVLPGFLDRIEEALAPQQGEPELKMARYQPDRYRLDDGEADEQQRRYAALVGLLRSGLLKRFESSVHAFGKTAQRMAEEHDLFLEGLDRGVVARKALLHELSAADDEDEIDRLFESGEEQEPAALFDTGQLRADVEADRDLLAEFARIAAGVASENDPKLAALIDELKRILAEAKADAADEQDEQRNRKVMIFSAFAETIDWIEGFLSRELERDQALRAYAGRSCSVAGQTARHGLTRDDAVHGFAPESSGAREGTPDRFDILLTTDVLAEGVNLQQCRNIINYDLPWNPMRLVQRHGRIDRINSRHPRVFLRTCFPDMELNRLLNLEHRVRSKLARAARSIGVEAAPIEGGAEGHQSFAESRAEIERLVEGDPTLFEQGGTEGAAQTGEEYRQELRQAMETRAEEITNLPWKAGSGLARGTQRGHFFCARVFGEEERTNRLFLRFVPWGDDEGRRIVSEVGTCLRIIECDADTARVMPQDLRQTAYAAWERARQHIYNAWMFETDPANLQPKVPKLNRELADFLRQTHLTHVGQAELDQALEAIEAPCSVREQNRLREVFKGEHRTDANRARAILDTVAELGLQPFEPPEPLPPIAEDGIRLICWMAVEAEHAAGG